MSKLGPGQVIELSDTIKLDDEFFSQLVADNKRLSFDESLRNAVQQICIDFEVFQKSWRDAPNSSEVTTLIKKALRQTSSIIKTVEEICDGSPASFVAEMRLESYLDRRQSSNFFPYFLSDLYCTENACQRILEDVIAEVEGKPGNGPDHPTNRFICQLAKVFELAGGGEATAYNRETDGKSRPGGPFVRFLLNVNHALPSEVCLEASALAYKAHDLLHPPASKARGKSLQK